MSTSSDFLPLESSRWEDYTLIDSGDGLKLERFGPYSFVRPEPQAIWMPALQRSEWNKADAVFRPTGEESGGHWEFRSSIPDRWEMSYIFPTIVSGPFSNSGPFKMHFWAMPTQGRHLGLFPEAASHWEFAREVIAGRSHPANVLNLFGYTGLASLAVAALGAHVTHVDASRKSVHWARANQSLSGLDDKPIRWIVDDALKFASRESRRGAQYDGLLIEPPKFGRGPKGEVWEIYKSLPQLLKTCSKLLGHSPLFVILTLYAVRASAFHLAQGLKELTVEYGGKVEYGELVTREMSANRLLSQAVFARWRAD
jgi:23S rRNA (cytosine1962-C5)-methyltransferase